jgi:hypothetical protein
MAHPSIQGDAGVSGDSKIGSTLEAVHKKKAKASHLLSGPVPGERPSVAQMTPGCLKDRWQSSNLEVRL